MRTILAIAIFISAGCAVPQSPQAVTMAFQPVLARLERLMPKFLKEANPDARKQFWDIISDKDATIEQTQSKLQEWATQQGGNVQKDFQTAEANIKGVIAALSDAIKQSSLSEAAKNAFQKLGDIASDSNQTFVQQLKQIVDYIKTVPEETRREMRHFVYDLVKSVQNN